MNDDEVVILEKVDGVGDVADADDADDMSDAGDMADAADADDAGDAGDMADADDAGKSPPKWLGTTAAAKRLGITTRTLYRFIDEGHVVAYRLGRVIRVKTQDVDGFIESCRIEPGTIGHLYPPVANRATSGDDSGADEELVDS